MGRQLLEELKEWLFESVSDGLLLVTRTGEILRANASAGNLSARSPEALRALDLGELLPESGTSRPGVAQRQALKQPDGSTREVHVCTHELADGTRLVLVRDVAATRHADAETRPQKDFIERLVESSVDGIVALDTHYTVTLYNSAMGRITGIGRDQVMGRNCFDVFPFLRAVGEDVLVDGALSGEDTAAHDRIFTVPESGRVGHYEARYSPFTDHEGRVIGIIGVIRDITERVAMQQRLVHAQKLETAGRLAGGMAHEFNNILTVILGEVALGRRASLHDDTLEATLRHIEDSAKRAGKLTRQLLAFSRQNFVLTSVFPTSELVSSVRLVAEHISGSRLRVQVVQRDDRSQMRADRAHAEQILTNLVLNAVDAMPDGGTLTLTTDVLVLSEPWELPTGSLAAGTYIAIGVRDSGQGMGPDVLARAFEPFYTMKPQAPGLGLCTSLGMAQQMGGTVRLESIEGAGTLATLYLPGAPASDDEKARTDVAVVGGREAVLLVEDEDRLRDVIRELLVDLGYSVYTARDGVEALSILSENWGVIDLVLSDIVMPRLGGRELVERVREMAPRLPVLLMTGYTDDPVVHQQVGQARWPILTKPFDENTLASTVRAALDGRDGDSK